MWKLERPSYIIDDENVQGNSFPSTGDKVSCNKGGGGGGGDLAAVRAPLRLIGKFLLLESAGHQVGWQDWSC